jgi:uncharacterized protein YbaP (TraB family)
MPKSNALLWSIQHPENKFTSYLFGTMHTNDGRAFLQKDLVISKIDECEVYAAEMSLDQINGDQAPSSTILLPRGKTINQYYSAKKYAKIRKRILIHTGLDIHPMRFYRPLIISNLITDSILQKNMSKNLDLFLWEYAQQANKEMMGIEIYKEQLHVMENIPLDYQFKALQSLAFHFANHRKQLQRSFKAYQDRDIWKLYHITRKGANKLRYLMIYRRNAIMADRIAIKAMDSSGFFAVGASHLAGAKGVLRYLKQKGFLLKPIE